MNLLKKASIFIEYECLLNSGETDREWVNIPTESRGAKKEVPIRKRTDYIGLNCSPPARKLHRLREVQLTKV